MPSFSGRFRLLDAGGTAIGEGSCQLRIEGESLLLVPSSGSPLACDLGDINVYAPGEYEISLKLYTGDTILLTHFAKAFQNLSRVLLEAYRARLVQCLLLEDLEEVERFDGWAQLVVPGAGFSSRAEIRIYRSNFAVLPETATGFSWRYADIDSIEFDQSAYSIRIHSNSDLLMLSRVAKRTEELIHCLQEGITAVSETGMRVIHKSFPFLTLDQFVRVAAAFKEGRAVPVRQLNEVHPQMEKALLEASVDANLKEYFDFLKRLCVNEGYFAGFKEIRKEASEARQDDSTAGQEDDAAANNEAAPEPEAVQAESTPAEQGEAEDAPKRILHWFFFPLKSAADSSVAGNIVAWEATSATGRATYFFRLLPTGEAAVLGDKEGSWKAVAAAVHRLNRAIVMMNFRREPIYLSDDSLQMQAGYRRYAIACRKIPLLRDLRASFLGRALHSSHEAWEKQVQAILAKAL